MKINTVFRKRKLGREYIITAEGLSKIDFNKMIVLNESASYLWDEVLGKDFSAEDLCQLLLDRYEVDPETAAADAGKIAQQWKDAGLLI